MFVLLEDSVYYSLANGPFAAPHRQRVEQWITCMLEFGILKLRAFGPSRAGLSWLVGAEAKRTCHWRLEMLLMEVYNSLQIWILQSGALEAAQ